MLTISTCWKPCAACDAAKRTFATLAADKRYTVRFDGHWSTFVETPGGELVALQSAAQADRPDLTFATHVAPPKAKHTPRKRLTR